MKKLLHITAIVLAVCAAAHSCKTSEENYRAAYEKAVAGRDSAGALENTIYGRGRRLTGFDYMAVPGGDTIAVRRQFVKLTGDSGDSLKRYCVVVGQFKQQFNAMSMRNRLASGNVMAGAFVVETSEPYYYVIGSSFSTIPEAAAQLRKYSTDKVLPFRAPLPFILDATTAKKR